MSAIPRSGEAGLATTARDPDNPESIPIRRREHLHGEGHAEFASLDYVKLPTDLRAAGLRAGFTRKNCHQTQDKICQFRSLRPRHHRRFHSRNQASHGRLTTPS